jgi:DNA-binding transcriptional regulator YdaS (Cro superfamily)
MELHDYIKKYGVEELAAKLGKNPLYLRQIGWGRAKPSFTLALEIIEATGGKVAFEDLARVVTSK